MRTECPTLMNKKSGNKTLRGKLNLTIHPEIREFAEHLATKRRRSISQLFEDLIEAEWIRKQGGYLAPLPSQIPATEQPAQAVL